MRNGRDGFQLRHLLTAGAVLALGLPGLPGPPALEAQQARERVRAEACRCVDADGNEIEDCTCFRAPQVAYARSLANMFGARARIGVRVDVGQDAVHEERGVHLEEVVEDGPAWEAGLREGDVIVRIDGRSVFDPLEDDEAEEEIDLDRSVPVQRFLALVRELEPDEPVEVEYLRDGSTRRATITPEENEGLFGRALVAPGGGAFHFRHAPDVDVRLRGLMDRERRAEVEARVRDALEDTERARKLRGGTPFGLWRLEEGDGDRAVVIGGSGDPCFTRRGEGSFVFFRGGDCVDGVHLEELNEELGAYFGGDEGVLVTDVAEESTLGLRPGDVILSIGARHVSEPDDVARILGSYEEDEQVTLTVRRQGEEIQLRGTRR